MYENKVQHVLSRNIEPLDEDTQSAMFQLFSHICSYWQNLKDPENYRSLLYAFMVNRINFDPLYRNYYVIAKDFIAELIEEKKGEEEAYKYLFTENDASGQKPPTSRLAITRQLVSNEFISFQLSVGGFKGFAPKELAPINYLGYFGGPNIPGAPPPYRPCNQCDGGSDE